MNCYLASYRDKNLSNLLKHFSYIRISEIEGFQALNTPKSLKCSSEIRSTTLIPRDYLGNICSSRSQAAILLILIILCTNQLQTRKSDFPSTVPTRDCTSLCVCILYRLERNTVKKLIPHCCYTETFNIKVTECKSKYPGILSSSQTVSRERSGTI